MNFRVKYLFTMFSSLVRSEFYYNASQSSQNQNSHIIIIVISFYSSWCVLCFPWQLQTSLRAYYPRLIDDPSSALVLTEWGALLVLNLLFALSQDDTDTPPIYSPQPPLPIFRSSSYHKPSISARPESHGPAISFHTPSPLHVHSLRIPHSGISNHRVGNSFYACTPKNISCTPNSGIVTSPLTFEVSPRAATIIEWSCVPNYRN